MGFSRQEYWSGLPFPSPENLSDPGVELRSPALQADSLLSGPPGKCIDGLTANYQHRWSLPKVNYLTSGWQYTRRQCSWTISESTFFVFFLTDRSCLRFICQIAQEDTSLLQTAAQGSHQSFCPHIGRWRPVLWRLCGCLAPLRAWAWAGVGVSAAPAVVTLALVSVLAWDFG